MTRVATELAALQDATDRLLDTAAALDEAAVAGPSRLPGWTRGHLLAHLARNADALVNVLAGRPMYPDETTRDADIARDADRPLAAHLADLRDSAARFLAAASALDKGDWERRVTLRNGVTDRAASLPFRRRVEVELHRIDLDAGPTVADLPGSFLDPAVAYLTARYDGHPGLPALELRAEDGRSWRTGATTGEPRLVVGTPAALVGWLSGRTAGSGLTSTEPLPEPPPL
ncbi:maleylpyruvate isomerase family mycothiol-dependent enzyme [Streptomyces sp. 3MP-14]|uniref:Maleylpyruvate isomerase family mycothiol-dependent enzyme n=1 Tax=Streptomyces mimosae TaxID=2586635 RepID=A0A5N6AMD7_9ACTN|nr:MULTISPECIES: maleylpyruvate isomerase family mycothiol-dependent enzyme [Streptomyces]KAB8168778.1 maleylpyruvate isomerase family mycothiol-dependent enzyme [Streptomyces mimosae]KAB8177942.1 maleylpyruvate isomerase family mycothiol-dependent enzyme [Streptomyces sp. 3MP-14]